MFRIYLAGSIFGVSEEDSKMWREEVKENLKDLYLFSDPTEKKLGSAQMSEIVESDKKLIDQCHILLVNHNKQTTGTAMEVLYGWERQKLVILVCPEEASPWLYYHGDMIFKDIKSAINYLKVERSDVEKTLEDIN